MGGGLRSGFVSAVEMLCPWFCFGLWGTWTWAQGEVLREWGSIGFVEMGDVGLGDVKRVFVKCFVKWVCDLGFVVIRVCETGLEFVKRAVIRARRERVRDGRLGFLGRCS